jgi:hypothetical protein
MAAATRTERSTVAHALVAQHHDAKATGGKSLGFRWYWLAWLCVTLVAFLVPELWAVFSGHMQLTLSDTTDALAAKYPWAKWTVGGALAVIAAGAVVLAMHFHLFR